MFHIKSVEGHSPSTQEVYKKTPKGRKEDKENKKTRKNPRNSKPKRTQHLPSNSQTDP
jgi:hypothetical protein